MICGCAMAGAFLAGAQMVWGGNDDRLRVQVPAAWDDAVADTLFTDDVSEPGWWRRFDDPVLDSLEQAALRNNLDISVASRRIAMARAAVGQARAEWYPQVSVSASYNMQRVSGRTSRPFTAARNMRFFDVGADVSWQIDVFGKIAAQVNRGKRNVGVTRAERAGVLVSVEAEVASNYLQLRVLQAELGVARSHSERQEKAMKIAEARFEAGLASMLDVDQARQVYYSTISSIPLLESSIFSMQNAIALLLGDEAEDVRPLLEKPRDLPQYVQLVQAGVPVSLLRRRPDIVQAERNIDVCAASLGIARKEWLPDLTLNASAGTQARRAGDLFTKNSFAYTVAPTLSWTVFDGLARNYAAKSAREEMESAIDTYNLTVLTAVSEVQTALHSYYSTLKYIETLEKAVEASADYDRLSLDDYKSGLAPYINVADAQISYLENMNSLIVAKGRALTSLVDLYKALGGGWEAVTYE